MKNFSTRLKEARGMRTQAEIARLIGVKQQAYARYEKGEVFPGAEILQQICLLFPCSADWLLGLRENDTARISAEKSAVAIGGDAANTVNDCRNCQTVARLTAVIEALSHNGNNTSAKPKRSTTKRK